MKYVNESVVFQEIPNEVTLAINISNCPCHCPGCHSKYLWGDIGDELTHEMLDKMLSKYVNAITCVSFMGGDASVQDLNDLAMYMKNIHPHLKVAWYSGKTILSRDLNLDVFDFVKIGPYIEHLGPLNSRTTNQRLYKKDKNNEWQDITHLFWKS